MTKQLVRTILSVLLLVTLFQCNYNSITNTVKLHPNDPFKNTIVASQTFNIDSKNDNVIEGKNGTIVICPKGCFKNGKDEIVAENVKIELSEALSIEDMLLSNLTTTSDGKPLETDGMIYFNATANGEQLTINKDNPIHIEIPTKENKPGMMVYKGTRDEKGNMNWIEPKELDKFLVTVDINSLDFLPPGFQMEVDKGMPFRNYKTTTQALTDSLYYSLSLPLSNGSDNTELRTEIISVPYDYNEPYYDKDKQVINGEYTDKSYHEETTKKLKYDSAYSPTKYGINPAIIKVIKSEKYQNTFIATKEFETRLKVIFKTCDDAVLETYINNLDKNLYEVDNMVAILFKKSEYYQDFINFSQQRLTKVKEADKYANLLKGYYKKELANVKSALEKAHEKWTKELDKKNVAAQKVADDYKKLLGKREKYRMETYGFNWTETGWINIDNGTLPKDWGMAPLAVTLTNGKEFDRIYTYVIYTSIKSLYRLNTTDNEQFYVGNEEEKEMIMPKKQLGVAIAIGYKNEVPSVSFKEFETSSTPTITMTLFPSSLDKIKEIITPYEKYAKENKIAKDLEFMAKFYEEEQRQKQLNDEYEFKLKLVLAAFPCCPVPTQQADSQN